MNKYKLEVDDEDTEGKGRGGNDNMGQQKRWHRIEEVGISFSDKSPALQYTNDEVANSKGRAVDRGGVI